MRIKLLKNFDENSISLLAQIVLSQSPWMLLFFTIFMGKIWVMFVIFLTIIAGLFLKSWLWPGVMAGSQREERIFFYCWISLCLIFISSLLIFFHTDIADFYIHLKQTI